MTDDLRRRFDALAGRLPEGSPNTSAVVAAGRRLKRRRLVAGTAGMLAVISLLVLAAANLDLAVREQAPVQPATHDDGVFKPAEPGEPTYILKDFEVKYPFAEVDTLPRMGPGSERRELLCSEPSRKASCESDGNAGFFYHWEWSTDRYPGIVECRVVLYSDDGDPVGEESWELSGLESTSRGLAGVLVVQVTHRPTSAEAECEAGAYEEGSGYRFTYVRSETYDPGMGLPERIRLFFEVEHLTEHAPDTRMCTLRVTFEGGKTTSGSFTMTGPREGLIDFDTGYPASDPVDSASLECEEYSGESSRSSKTADNYRLVAREGDMRVFAPSSGQRWGWCPQKAQDLAARDLSGAEDAVLLAKDEITGRGLNTEDAHTTRYSRRIITAHQTSQG